jgi:hypothetical protein
MGGWLLRAGIYTQLENKKTYVYYRQPLQDELDEFYRATGLMSSLPDDAKIENDDRSAVWTALLCGKS